MSNHLFVTGMPRTGTTLLDKLLSLHPEIDVLSQPLPLLYVRVKEAFLGARSAEETPPADRPFPLDDMLGGSYYPPGDMVDFLEHHRLERDFCRRCLEEMIPFSGQYTKPEQPLAILDGYRPTTLFDFVDRYCRSLVAGGRGGIVGSKETFCEELIPYFLARGARVLLILRDPRDVLVSLDHGTGKSHGGRRKPPLFNLRQWRKSVAFALAYQADPGFLSLRYEDLVREPGATLERVTDFLRLEPLEPSLLEGDLRSQSGEIWHGNSSHFASSRITPESVGRYRQHLSRSTDRFVQALCFAEMSRLGYALDLGAEDVEGILAGHREDQPLERPELAGYRWAEPRRDEEIARWRRLRAGRFDPRSLLFEPAFVELRRQLENGGR